MTNKAIRRGRQIGVLGGTFDPIHLAHLRLAEEAREQLGLERVLFLPAPQPWRKAGRAITPIDHRLAMVQLAVADNPFFAVSTIELELPGPTYTATTLTVLLRLMTRGALVPDLPAAQRTHGPGLHFILGADALLDLPNWHEPQRIISLARLAVTTRASTGMPDLAALEALVPSVSAAVEHVTMPVLEISSSDIRERARQGLSLRYLVPPAVIDYINGYGLYSESSGA